MDEAAPSIPDTDQNTRDERIMAPDFVLVDS
jgi:hypothetical protein